MACWQNILPLIATNLSANELFAQLVMNSRSVEDHSRTAGLSENPQPYQLNIINNGDACRAFCPTATPYYVNFVLTSHYNIGEAAIPEAVRRGRLINQADV
jgi:hypothetical protein